MYVIPVLFLAVLDIHSLHSSPKKSVPAWTMEPTQSEMNILSNGKSHDPEGDLGMPMKTLPEEDQWVFSLYFKHRWMTALCRLHSMCLALFIPFVFLNWYLKPHPGLFQQLSFKWTLWCIPLSVISFLFNNDQDYGHGEQHTVWLTSYLIFTFFNACSPCFRLTSSGGSLFRNGTQTVRYVCADLCEGFLNCILVSMHIIIQRNKQVYSRYVHHFKR